jgi:hypothetical protein
LSRYKAPFRATLELANRCDHGNAATTEIRFVADTDRGINESTSFWLRQ